MRITCTIALALCIGCSSSGSSGPGGSDGGSTDALVDGTSANDAPNGADGPGLPEGGTTGGDAMSDGHAGDAATEASAPGDASVFDPSFGDAGAVWLTSPLPDAGLALERIESIAARPDGRIVLGVSVNYRGFAVAQLLADGSGFDDTFGTGGIALMPSWDTQNNEAYYGKGSVGLTSSGGVVFAYGCPGSDPTGTLQDTCITRLMSDGSIDTTFGNGGTVDYAITSFNYQVSIAGLAVDANDQVWFTGDWTNINGNRFNSFLGGPFGLVDTGGDCPAVAAPPGRGLQVCTSQGEIVVSAFLMASGFADTSFGQNGVVSLGSGTARGIAVHQDGTIVVVGESQFGGSTGLVATRLSPSGALLASFADAGTASLLAPGPLSLVGVASLGPADYAAGMMLTADGGSEFAVIKLVPSGVDPSYGAAGLGLLDTGGNPLATAMGVQDGGVLVAGALGGATEVLARAKP